MCTFSVALERLKNGDKVSRKGWNGANQYINMQVPDAHSKMGAPYLYLFNSQQKNIPWVPSQGDLFAEDWIVV